MMKGVKYICRGWCLTRAVKIKFNYTAEDEANFKYCRQCKAIWPKDIISCPCCRKRLNAKSRSLVRKKKYIE